MLKRLKIHVPCGYVKNICSAILIIVLANVLIELVVQKFFKMPNYVRQNVSFIGIVITVIVSPLIEETLFRKVILDSFLSSLKKAKLNCKLNVSMSILLSSAIFSAAHMQLFFLPYFVTSIIISFFYLKMDHDLKSAILIHSGYNLITCLVLFVN